MQKISVPDYAKKVLTTLNNAGFEAYVVGGCCRDALLGRAPNDWDICTSARPKQVMQLFPENIPTGLKHGTVTVKTKGGLIEITTYRIDGEYMDHRRPDDVVFTSKLEDDLSRRDFTMNAMAADVSGVITDPFNGICDIENRLIRCVGDANKRFNEDALRMFRAVRFACQLGFSLDDDLVFAMSELADTAGYVAAERIYTETIKSLLSSYPETLAVAFELGLYSGIKKCSPELSIINSLPLDIDIRLTALCAALLKAEAISSAADFLRSLRATSAQIRAAELIFDPEFIWTKRDFPHIAAALGREYALSAAAAMEVFGFSGCFDKMSRLLNEGRCLSVKELDISGNELISLGFSGRDVGKCLGILLDHVLKNPQDNKKEILLTLAKNRPD